MEQIFTIPSGSHLSLQNASFFDLHFTGTIVKSVLSCLNVIKFVKLKH